MVTKLNKLENTHKEDFYISDSTECVYQPDQKERKLFTFIKGSKDKDFYNLLISRGFRRSQNILYNQVCEGCNKCIPIRIKTNNFKAKKNQKRILSKGKIFQRNITEKATYEQFYLFKEYLNYKHPDSEMNDMIFADYYSMIKNSGIDTKIIEYRLDNILISSCITDFLKMYKINSSPDRKNIGIWVKNRKIAAVGLRVSKWIAFHGCSINISNLSLIHI